jgi:hypothetical protein
MAAATDATRARRARAAGRTGDASRRAGEAVDRLEQESEPFLSASTSNQASAYVAFSARDAPVDPCRNGENVRHLMCRACVPDINDLTSWRLPSQVSSWFEVVTMLRRGRACPSSRCPSSGSSQRAAAISSSRSIPVSHPSHSSRLTRSGHRRDTSGMHKARDFDPGERPRPQADERAPPGPPARASSARSGARLAEPRRR